MGGRMRCLIISCIIFSVTAFADEMDIGAKLEEVKAKISEMQQENAELKTTLEEREQEIANLQEQLKELEEQAALLESEEM